MAAWFQIRKSTIDLIFYIKVLMEETIKGKRKASAAFIDLEKLFKK